MLKQTPIRQVWNWLRPKLEYVKDIRGGTWRPEDVYAACVNNEAFLYTAPEGFVALKPMVDDYSGERFLLVWIAQGDGGDCIDRYQEQLIEIARDAGYNRLQFWRRPHGECESKGWKKAYTIYELEIPA